MKVNEQKVFNLIKEQAKKHGAVIETVNFLPANKNRLSINVSKYRTVNITYKGVSEEFICNFIIKHIRWIIKRIKAYETQENTLKSGLRVYIFGELTTLPNKENKQQFINNLCALTLKKMSELTNVIAKENGFLNIKVKITKDKSKWAYCNVQKREIRFNPACAFLNQDELFYLVAHELSHLKIANHSKKFWEQVKNICPNYLIMRKLVKQKSMYINYLFC